MNQNGEVQSQLFKLGTVWAAVGITSWADVASFLAALYSAFLIGEWLWKKAIRPMCVMRGWVKPLPKVSADA